MASENSAYEPIPRGDEVTCIRVLDVHAATINDEPIRAELRIIDLRSKPTPTFCSLSYVWGSSVEGESHSVLCGAHAIPILPNGYNALAHLRLKLGSFTIWIDAICINQKD